MADWDVIIVGGGIAGLSIAEYLIQTHKRVLVLEQYGAWGGRIATYRSDAKEDIPKLQYEIGAGRIHHTHHRVKALVERFHLSTYPIPSDSWFEGKPNSFLQRMTPLKKVLSSLSDKDLATHTIYELIPESMKPIFAAYPYWAEIQLMRADSSLESFDEDKPMGSQRNTDFFGIKDGLDSFTKNIQAIIQKAGVDLQNHHTVADIQKNTQTNMLDVTGLKNKTEPFHYTTNKVVIATPFSEFKKFTVLKHTPMMKQLQMSPLIRIYAVYPPSQSTNKVWFAGMKKNITTNPLRYIIPINEKTGLIMISYTDGKDTDFWRAKKDEVLEKAIQENLHKVYPTLDIPKPIFLKKHDWLAGCTYWLPGDYDIHEASLAAHNPAPNVYVCGESVSENQAWIEGALESVETLKKLCKK